MHPGRGFLMSVHATSRDRIASWLEAGLFTISLLFLGWWTAVRFEASTWQARQEQRLQEATQSETPLRDNDGLVGRIEIPRVGVSAMIGSGVDAQTLSHAVGHIPGTGLPGKAGNIGLAGHRDSFFRGLRGLTLKDRIEIATPDGQYEYAVDSIQIVEPGRADLLRPTAGETLTLVTCYPFSYIGQAPKRFVVKARRVSTSLASVSSL
jgi:sortase A